MRDIAESAVADFASTMDVDSLNFPDNGDSICFEFDEDVGQFFVEYDDAGMYLCLVRDLAEYEAPEKAATAFLLCHYKRSRKYDTQMAIKDSNKMILLVYLAQHEVIGTEVEAVLRHLVQLYDAIYG
ncbi:MAG: hypothetical protein KAG53_05780 [Endozoicomonadaceae bacterium]|nr:hypothetical protein [Endozoicomonadaceae bacterium]